jgi:hypothetical protein
LLGVQGVASSNLAVPTNKESSGYAGFSPARNTKARGQLAQGFSAA